MGCLINFFTDCRNAVCQSFVGMLLVSLCFLGCGDNSSSAENQENHQVAFEYDTLTDARDGIQYKTIQIGSQKWMAENLKYAYVDNDKLSCKDGLKSNCDSLGRYYTWAEAMDSINSGCGTDYSWICTQGKYALPKHFRGICPEGWRLPTEEDWITLITYAGGADSAGLKLSTTKLRDGWDSFGFNALPTGKYYWYMVDSLNHYGNLTFFWTSSEHVNGGATSVLMGAGDFFNASGSGELYWVPTETIMRGDHKADRMMVRCIEGESLGVPEKSYKTEYDDSVLVDKRDGQVYKVVSIGNEVWMAENLNYEYNDGAQSVCYKEDSVDCQKYGRLYTWAGAMGLDETKYGVSGSTGFLPYPHRGVCPEGWHIPSVDEFLRLIEAVGGFSTEGKDPYVDGKLLKDGDALMSTYGWNYDWNGSDKVGFSALPAGHSNFYLLETIKKVEIDRLYGFDASFWSDTEKLVEETPVISSYAYYLLLSPGSIPTKNRFDTGPKGSLMSVRCVRD
ncbi:MAG: hypothetical protein IKT05_01885 [Fibrobacter sp.]|nr:hypothetical protein [Fibrobacter sp.]